MSYVPVSTSEPIMPGGLRLPQVRDVQVGQQPSNLPTTTFQLLQQPTTIPPQTNPLLSSRSAAIPALGRGQPPPRLPFSLASNRTPLAPTQQASGYYTPKPPDYAPYTSQDVENQVPEEIASSVNPEITSANDVPWRPSPGIRLDFAVFLDLTLKRSPQLLRIGAGQRDGNGRSSSFKKLAERNCHYARRKAHGGASDASSNSSSAPLSLWSSSIYVSPFRHCQV